MDILWLWNPGVHTPGLPLLLYFFLLQHKIIGYNLDCQRFLCFLRITLQVDLCPVIPSKKT